MINTTITNTDTNLIRRACEEFLASWNRAEWMSTHGSWASESWNEKREMYDEALSDVEQALEEVPTSGDRASTVEVQALLDAVQELMSATKALDGQVVPEFDHVAEGLIDPHGVSDKEIEILDVRTSAQGWDCIKGWCAYRYGNALFLNWYRSAWGDRRERDLWVQVDPDFFGEQK